MWSDFSYNLGTPIFHWVGRRRSPDCNLFRWGQVVVNWVYVTSQLWETWYYLKPENKVKITVTAKNQAQFLKGKENILNIWDIIETSVFSLHLSSRAHIFLPNSPQYFFPYFTKQHISVRSSEHYHLQDSGRVLEPSFLKTIKVVQWGEFLPTVIQ